jgi:uncharacterized protein
VILLPDFEFDEEKSRANAEKHGIDFYEAQELWLDADLLRAPGRSVAEPRFLFIGRIDGRHWVAVATVRSNRLRLISVRRARNEEVEAYGRERA